MTFKTGDKVRIVKYGALLWITEAQSETILPHECKLISEDNGMRLYDCRSEMIGKTGVVESGRLIQGMEKYSLTEIDGKQAWYNTDQLELL